MDLICFEEIKDNILSVFKLALQTINRFPSLSFVEILCVEFLPILINNQIYVISTCFDEIPTTSFVCLENSPHFNHPESNRWDIDFIKKVFPITKEILLLKNALFEYSETNKSITIEFILSFVQKIFEKEVFKNYHFNHIDCLTWIIKKIQNKNLENCLEKTLEICPETIIKDLLKTEIRNYISPFLNIKNRQKDLIEFKEKFGKIYFEKQQEIIDIKGKIPPHHSQIHHYFEKQLSLLNHQVLLELCSENQYESCAICCETLNIKFFSSFDNCCHSVCSSCAEKIDTCPFCRNQINLKKSRNTISIKESISLMKEYLENST